MSEPSPWRGLIFLLLVAAPIAVASALIQRARLDWVYCLAAANGSAPRHPAPGLFAPDTLAALVTPSLALVAVVGLAFAGVAALASRPGRTGLGYLGWAALFATLVAFLIDPGALHDCDLEGTVGEFRLLLLVPAGWGFTAAALIFNRPQSR